MRFSGTIDHSNRRDAWQQAYAVIDGLSDAGDDGVGLGGTEASDIASKAEYAALTELIASPSTTTAEMQDKIAVMRSRGPLTPENLCWDNDEMKVVFDQIERDLMNLSRPNASPLTAAAFAKWADAYEHFHALRHSDDAELGKRGDIAFAALEELRAIPCTTPGDFIVKSYADLLQEVGPDIENGGAFFPDLAAMDKQDERVWKDIIASDLGCCMVALGRTDFDAGRWASAAKMHGKEVIVLLTERGRSLMLGMDGPHTEMDDILQRLTANGLRLVSADRCVAIGDEIEAHYPDFVQHVRENIAA